MEWKKRKVVINIWESCGFKIVEDVDGEDRPFRLESPFADPEWFGNIEMAKSTAKLQNELALVKEANEQLRAELAQARGVWPDLAARYANLTPAEDEAIQHAEAAQADRDAEASYELLQAADAAREALEDQDAEEFDDGRGIPSLPIRETVSA